ncbi:hypothetical protein CRENBAI_025164 [Crenichthys baileyi]|uniref:Uncharacterized protein n=1 Tax=Crenichthys baileyi TaxID=28760 RepID=A0AAV9S330_9TELE
MVTADMITASMLTAGMTTTSIVTAGMVTAGIVTAGMVTADMITAGIVTAGMVTAGIVTAGMVTADMVTAGIVTAGMVTAGIVTAGMVTADMITAGIVTAGMVTAGIVTAGMVTADMVTAGMPVASSACWSESHCSNLKKKKMLNIRQWWKHHDDRNQRERKIFQLRCDEKKKQNKDIVLKSSALQKDMCDILEYLQHFLTELEKEEKELMEQMEKQLQDDRKEKKALELLVSQEKQELQEKSDKLSSGNNMQAARLEDQKVQLIHLEQQMLMQKSLDQKLKHLDDQHSTMLVPAQRSLSTTDSVVEEKKKTVMSSIKLKVSAMIEEETAEHRKMVMEVKSLSEKSYLLQCSKTPEQDRVKSLCRTVITLRIMTYKLSRKIFSLRKESVMLVKRCKLLTGHIEELQSSTESLQAYKEAYRQCLTSVSEECRQRVSVAALLEERLQRERSWMRKLEGDLRRAASVLTAIATDPKKIPGAQVKMHKLLQVLDTSELQERGISGELKPQTPEVEAASTDTENISKDPLFLMAKLRPGDLCLVPGPTWEPRAAAPSLSSQAPGRSGRHFTRLILLMMVRGPVAPIV